MIEPTITFSASDHHDGRLTKSGIRRWREFYIGPYAEMHGLDKTKAGEWFDVVLQDAYKKDKPTQ